MRPIMFALALAAIAAPVTARETGVPAATPDGAPINCVRLSDVRGPAVLNVWGSWCGPCRAELPMVQHLAERSKGKLTVLGVDTRDARDAAASFGAEQKISFPMVFDPDQKFLAGLGRANVPLTVFVNAAGRTYVQVQPLDPDTLTETVRQHTGVTVTP